MYIIHINTITVEVPQKIAQKYGKKSLKREKLLELLEEYLRTDVPLKTNMEMLKFYQTIKES